MRQFWDLVIAPVLETLRPRRILEVGVDQGLTTRRLAEYAASHGAVLEVIDPNPKIDVEAWQREFGASFRCHLGLSLEVLPNLSPFDVALIDGDHNWYTVSGELQALETLAMEGRGQPPLVLLHDVAWPYARRDLYYDASSIPKWNRQPHQVAGLIPGQNDLAEAGGFNAHLDHALFEGGERNGVLTAVDEFMATSPGQWRLTALPGLNGIGVLVPQSLLDENGRLREAVEGLTQPERLLELVELVERERLESETRRQADASELAELEARPAPAEAASSADPQMVETLEATVEALEADVTSARHQAEQLEAELDTARRQSSEAEASVTDRAVQQERLRELESERRELEARATRADTIQAEAAALQAERERAASALSAALEKVQSLESESLTAARERAELEGRAAVASLELETLRTRATEEHETARTAAKQARTARAEAADATVALERLERRSAQFERRDDELEEELSSYRRRLREAIELREDHEYRASLLERRLADQERELDEARAAAAASVRAELAGQRDVAARDAEITELTASRLRLTTEQADLRETMEQALAEARWQAETAQASARELRERLEVREVESDGLEDQLAQLRDALAAARIDTETARAHLQALELRHVAAAPDPPPAPVAPPEPDPSQTATPPVATEPVTAKAPVLDAPPPDDARALSDLPFMKTEMEAFESFRTEYPSGFEPTDGNDLVDLLALPDALNFRGYLRAEHDPDAIAPSVDVLVCVHNALEDVRRCLWSLIEKTDRPFRLVLINDGSDVATTEYLESIVAREPAVHLVRNPDPPHGYTIAANLGLHAATGDYLVLLNSDTVVTNGWLDRIVACGEAEPAVGILGPLSNAASHQSVPDLRSGGSWSTNPLPPFATADGLAKLLERVSPQHRPRLPFINGFCYVIKRAVIDAIGYFDEEHFASGYCEENDFSYRAGEAGFELAVVDDAYVFHAKSKSFGVETRKVIAKRNYDIFLEKHGPERIQALVKDMETNTALAPLRARVSDAMASPQALAGALDSGLHEPLSVMFILPGLGAGGSGGSHSIYQEVHGMRRLGLDARIALSDSAFGRARAAYDDADELFVPFRDADDLASATAHADVISATHFKSAVMLADLYERRQDFLPAYYVQDYEPFFTSRDNVDFEEATASYTLVPDCLLFAKTHWLCNIVASRHRVRVAKVEPSIDEGIYRPRDARRVGGPLRITAMIRPRTPRRQPTATVAVLEEIAREYGADVRVVPFGCPAADLHRLTDYEPLLERHRGLLSRTEVSELLGESHVFLDMSMYQAFGRTALEAMACGATAVVPRLGGVWEFLEHDGNGLAVDAFEPRQAYDALASFVEDRDRLHRLQQRALVTGGRYSILRAALSEYLVFAREHASRFGAGARARTS